MGTVATRVTTSIVRMPCVPIGLIIAVVIELPQKMCPVGTFVNNDHHVMAEHPPIYPTQEDTEAVQNMVSHREWTLKVMSYWITEQEEGSVNHAESENMDVPKKDESKGSGQGAEDKAHDQNPEGCDVCWPLGKGHASQGELGPAAGAIV